MDRVDGKIGTGKEAAVVDVAVAAGEEEVEDFEEAGMVREVDSVVVTEAVDVVVVDTATEVLEEVTTSQEEAIGGREEEEEDIRETGTSQPPMAGRGTNFHSAIHMFTQKTADFYRFFLDRLYEVADLLTERPSPEPPDPTPAQSRVQPAPLEGLLGRKLAWTRKWTFQLFVKKRRRKRTAINIGERFSQDWQWLIALLLLPTL